MTQLAELVTNSQETTNKTSVSLLWDTQSPSALEDARIFKNSPLNYQ